MKCRIIKYITKWLLFLQIQAEKKKKCLCIKKTKYLHEVSVSRQCHKLEMLDSSVQRPGLPHAGHSQLQRTTTAALQGIAVLSS